MPAARSSSINSHLRTLTITILRADELPGLIGRCRYPSDSQWLREEQATIGHPVGLRIRRSQLDNELQQVNSVIGAHLRAAIEAASAHVITAAGGPASDDDLAALIAGKDTWIVD